MNFPELIKHVQAHGADLLAAVHEHPVDALLEWGLSPATARSWSRAAEVYFGPTNATRKQADCVAAARRNQHSADTLAMINRYAARVDAPWKLRLELCRMPGSYAEIEAVAKEKVKELAPEPVKPAASTKVYRPRKGPWKFVYTGAPQVVADLDANLSGETPAERAASFEDLVFGDGSASRATITTNAIIHLDEHARIIAGDGDDVLIALTNGTIMTGQEYVNARLSEHGYITLCHPLEGPVNAYRTERLANKKQRIMASAENPVCAWPDCNSPADLSQIHHLTEWRNGGDTNASNLATCCAYHNAINGLRGRLFRHRGRIYWKPPGGGKPRRNEHPATLLAAMR